MNIEPGRIYMAILPTPNPFGAAKGPVLCVSETVSGGLLCIPLSSDFYHGSVTIDGTSLGGDYLSATLHAVTDSPFTLPIKNIISNIAAVSQDKLDEILRGMAKTAAAAHYRLITARKRTDYVPPSGKCVGQEELEMMTDATLDMWLTEGRFNARLEKKLQEYFRLKYALTVNSGSSANLLAITALTSHALGNKRLKEGDEVLTLAAGFPTTVAPIIQNRLTPVFTDVEPDTYNIDPDKAEKAISSKTRAIFVAHTLGNPFNLDRIIALCKKHNLWLIEDNCDAFGARYKGRHTGTFGHMATFSFYPAHHMTTGEGGAVLTNHQQLYEILLSLRDWGRDCRCRTGHDNACGHRFDGKFGQLPQGYDHKYVYSHLGYNMKMTDWQAAIGLAQIEKVSSFIEKRQANFQILFNGLRPFESFISLPRHEKHTLPSWFGLPLSVKPNTRFGRNALVQFLESRGVGTRPLFAGNLLRHPAILNADFNLKVQNSGLISSKDLCKEFFDLLPETENTLDNAFWIGVWPGIDTDGALKILQAFSEFFNRLNH